MRLLRTLSLLLVAALALGVAAHAQETGSISGVVKDTQGGVLPGVTVKVSGPLLPAGRETVTTATGNYLFLRLLPGIYKVEAGMTGMGKAATEVRVYLDVDAQVNLVLSPTATEQVTVVAQAETVDLKKTEVNFNYTADATKDLPLGRSYSGLFQLIPGVAQNNSCRSRRGRQPPGQHVPDGRRQHHEPRLRLPRDRGERARHRRVQRQARRDQRGVRPCRRHRDQRGQPLGHEHLLRQRPHPVPAGVLHERPRRPGLRSAADGLLQPGDRPRRADREGQGVLLRLGPVPEDDPGRPREQVRHGAARPRELHAGVLRQDHVHPDPEAPPRGELSLPADRLRGQQRRVRQRARASPRPTRPGPRSRPRAGRSSRPAAPRST